MLTVYSDKKAPLWASLRGILGAIPIPAILAIFELILYPVDEGDTCGYTNGTYHMFIHSCTDIHMFLIGLKYYMRVNTAIQAIEIDHTIQADIYSDICNKGLTVEEYG